MTLSLQAPWAKKFHWYSLILSSLCLGLFTASLAFAVDKKAGEPITVADVKADPKIQDVNAESISGIAEQDLPPAGTRSLFDHMLKENNGIPFPFSKLSDLLASYSKDGEKPIGVLIPKGRSLVKAMGDFNQPRVVLAVSAKQPDLKDEFSFNLKNRMFIGYIEKANQLEVISYNEKAGRFEYQLVEDYREGGQPLIVYARRGLCIACHQGEGTIFPVRPWDETNGQAHIYNKIFSDRKEKDRAAIYHSVPIQGTLSSPEAYDATADLANSLVVGQMTWTKGCGGNAPEASECRRQLLQQALFFAWDPGLFDVNSESYTKYKALQKKFWPAEGISVMEGDIKNRNPLEEPEAKEGFFSSLFSSKGNESDEDKLKKLAPLPTEQDPLTKRVPKAILNNDSDEGIFSVSQIFSNNEIRWISEASDYNFDKIVAILKSKDMDEFLKNKPLYSVAVTLHILKNLGVKKLPKPCCDSVKGMSDPKLMGVKPLAIAKGSKLVMFEQYCFSCHRGNPSAKLDFLNGDNEEAVWAKMKDTPEIKEVLDWDKYKGKPYESKMMPPSDSYQHKLMEKDAAESKRVRKEMMDALPSFLF